MYEKAVEIAPDSFIGYAGLAWAYEHHAILTRNEEDRELRRRNIEIAYRLNPSSARTIVGMAYEYGINNPEESERIYQSLKRAMQFNPNISEVNHVAGIFFENRGLYHQAVKCYSRAVELDPFYLLASTALANTYYKLGEFEKAVLYYKKILEIAPDAINIHLNYARVFISEKKYQEAEAMIAKAEKNYPDSSRIARIRALLLAARGESENALALHTSAAIYSLLGMKDEALNYIDEQIKDKSIKVGAPYSYLYLKNSPFYDGLRDDIRFREILEKLKTLYDVTLEKFGDF